MALIVLFNSTFFPSRLNGDHYVSTLLLLSLAIGTAFSIAFFAKKINELPKSIKGYIYTLLILALLIIQFLISTHVIGANGVDDFDVRIQATKLSFHDLSW
jgi:hypothetical protein